MLTFLEVHELVRHLRVVHGAGAVLLPLVAPEGELVAVGVDVGPVGLQLGQDGLDLEKNTGNLFYASICFASSCLLPIRRVCEFEILELKEDNSQ